MDCGVAGVAYVSVVCDRPFVKGVHGEPKGTGRVGRRGGELTDSDLVGGNLDVDDLAVGDLPVDDLTNGELYS